MAFKTTHKLDFEAAPWPRHPLISLYRVGTCHGQWFVTESAYCIISIINETPGNGHLNDVFEWFFNSCRRDKKALIVMELMNERFKKHLMEKRGFHDMGENHVIKEYSEL